MPNTNEISRSAFSRKALLSRLMTSAVPAAVLLSPTVAFADTAVNTATVSAPAGTFEANTANNSATDTDNVLAVIVATNDTVGGVNGLAGATAVVNAFTSDTINGVAASSANAVL
ncbi:hypothetical protein WAB17_00005, partial [Parerythrobacter aurantius]|uniref:hypothetical protein n=1 Tax=Parerythrobacter aurantius TaxID=3127706 RepID=UPI003249414F